MINIIYTVSAEQDDMPVRGNALASGDDKVDKECEDEILERLGRGDEWAWALVKVTAAVTLGDYVFSGKAYLGGCSYANEAEFKTDAYYLQMCKEAREDLVVKLRETVAVSIVAQAVLGHLEAAGLL